LETLGESLDRSLAPGRVEVESDGARAVAEVSGVDRYGVQVRSLHIHRAVGEGLQDAVSGLPDALRALPERILPVEVSPSLGGAILRSDPRDMIDQEYFEVRTDGQDTSVHRYRRGSGSREEVPFTLTRDQVRRVVRGLTG
jgi:hypothetical protein